MAFIKPRPKGTFPPPREYRIPSSSPTSWDVVRAGIKRRLADGPIGRVARLAVERNIYIVGGNASNCSIDPTATMANAIINATSGTVTVCEDVFLGHGVQLLTGTHDISLTGQARKTGIPDSGRDIVIERGAWIASNVTVIGPCRIGESAVICAGAVVIHDVAPRDMVGGVPAKLVKHLEVEKPYGGVRSSSSKAPRDNDQS